jgi:integrase/recombinase XerD
VQICANIVQMPDASISLYLDTRRGKDEHRFPVKLRVYFNYETRYYLTGIDLSEEDFKRSVLSHKPKGHIFKDFKIRLSSIVNKAEEISKELKIFSFEKFETRFLRPTGAGVDVFYHYRKTINNLEKEERLGTASNYNLSSKSIKRFLRATKRKDSYLSFDEITLSFLKDYERWMISEGRSRTTVGIYLRPLRALFNTAIADGEIPPDIYPFGRRKFEIPAGRNIKKALDKESLKCLFEADTKANPIWEKAKDFWFFSYTCNGMNIKDIAELKYKNLSGDMIHFIRSKTKNSTKGNHNPILVPLTPFSSSVISKYGNKTRKPDDYIFSIIEGTMKEEEKRKSIQAFTRFINQHIKILAKSVGIDDNLSTYWARHSFTTMAIHKGASLEFVQESLGHNSITTTMNYWKGFEVNAKKEIANKLLDFNN